MPTKLNALLFLGCVLAVAQTQNPEILDEFTKDASLNTALWTTSTPTLQRLASVYVNGTVNGAATFIQPQVTFSTNGMTFGGVNGAFQIGNPRN